MTNKHREHLKAAKTILPNDPQSASAHALIAIYLLLAHVNGVEVSANG